MLGPRPAGRLAAQGRLTVSSPSHDVTLQGPAAAAAAATVLLLQYSINGSASTHIKSGVLYVNLKQN
jgi:hypothetical protein